MKFTNTITINRQPAAVFRFLAHFENVPRWNYAISKTQKITGGPVGVGSRYRQTRTLPTASEETFEVTEFEPNRKLSIRGALGPLRGEVAYLIAPAENGTNLTNIMNLQPSHPWGFVAPLVVYRIKSAVAANLDTLRQILDKASDRPDDR
jgi:uncharacterized protein YndB with AHSA1/START domain